MTSTYWTNKFLHGLHILTTNKERKYWHHETAGLELVGWSPVDNTSAVCTQHKEQPTNQNQLWTRVSFSPYFCFGFAFFL